VTQTEVHQDGRTLTEVQQKETLISDTVMGSRYWHCKRFAEKLAKIKVVANSSDTSGSTDAADKEFMGGHAE
jgi:hypothetical protein